MNNYFKNYSIAMTSINYTQQRKLIVSLQKGQYEVFKKLLQDPSVDPSVDNNRIMVMTACHGFIQALKLLLKDHRVDPSANDNLALKCANVGGHLAVVTLLLQDPRVDPNVFHTNEVKNFGVEDFSEESIGILSAKLIFPEVSAISSWKPIIDKYREELLIFAYDLANCLPDDIIKFIIFPLLFGINLAEYRALDKDYINLKIRVT
jgi:hypothetical protein